MKLFLNIIFVMASCLLISCSGPPKPMNDPSLVEKYRQSKEVLAKLSWQVSYLESGNPKGKILILIHGTPGSASGWTDFIVNPNPLTQVIAIDRPGFGKTMPNQAEPSISEQAEVVAAFFPKDGRKVILAGHSLGGPIAAKVAADYPDRVETLILLAASMDPSLEKIHPMQYVGNWFWVRPLLPQKIDHANQELLGLKAELTILENDLGKITSKVIIVHGDADNLVPIENVAYLQKHLVNAKSVSLHLMEKQNHFLPWNAQDKLNEAITEAINP